MYSDGDGVSKNYHEAIKWFAKSAENGSKDAKYNLGVMYYNGEGVSEDNVQAYMWMYLATQNRSSYASQTLKRIQKHMATNETEEGQRLSIEWQKNRYKEALEKGNYTKALKRLKDLYPSGSQKNKLLRAMGSDLFSEVV